MADRVLGERVVGGHDGAAGVPEDHVDAFGDEGLPNRLCSSPLHRLAFSERGKKKSPATFRCGARSCRNLTRSERWPAPLAKEAKKAKAKKDEGARVGGYENYASRAAIHPLQV